DANAVDERVLALDKRAQHILRRIDPDVDEPNLADIALELEELGIRRVAPADSQHLAPLGQAFDDVPPDKPRAAHDGNLVSLHGRGITTKRVSLRSAEGVRRRVSRLPRAAYGRTGSRNLRSAEGAVAFPLAK